MQPKKYAIYTAIVGEYDEVKQPKVVNEQFDYILFSNDIKEEYLGVWQIRPIKYHNDVQTKIARYVKTHPEDLLSEYKASVWIDASVVIESDYIYKRTIELVESQQLISTHIHPDWICTYEEMLGIMMLQWESEETTIKWGQYLRKENFPRQIGTWETRVLYRLHSNKRVGELDSLWWWCIENFSRRDQYSFQYVLWKLGIECVSFLPIECGVHNSEHFTLRGHINTNNKHVGKKRLDSWLLRYYEKHADERTKIENLLYKIYGKRNANLLLKIYGQIYRLKHIYGYISGKKTIYAWEFNNEKK